MFCLHALAAVAVFCPCVLVVEMKLALRVLVAGTGVFHHVSVAGAEDEATGFMGDRAG